MRKKQGTETIACQQPELGELFPFYLNGEVTADEAKRIEGHLARCPECQKEMALWMAISVRGLPSWRGERRGGK